MFHGLQVKINFNFLHISAVKLKSQLEGREENFYLHLKKFAPYSENKTSSNIKKMSFKTK